MKEEVKQKEKKEYVREIRKNEYIKGRRKSTLKPLKFIR